MVRNIALVLSLGAVLGGCALKDLPSGEALGGESNISIPSVWKSAVSSKELRSQGWIDSFGDPQLRRLVDEALKNNPDIHIAAAKVEQASSYVTIASSSLVPSLDAGGAKNIKADGDEGSSTLAGWGVFVSWEVDLWGRARYESRASESTLYSAQADELYAQYSIAALVAKGWFAAIEAHRQKYLLQSAIAQAKEIAKLTKSRVVIGAGSEYDYLQAQNVVTTLEENLQKVAFAQSNALRSIEVLTGKYPDLSIVPSSSYKPLNPIPSAGLPSGLLERRPDIIAAKYRLLSAFDMAQEAQAARLPRISLDAAINDFSSDLFVLQGDGVGKSITGGITAPLFHGGALAAQADMRSSQQKEASARYIKSALAAFYEVENTLAHNQSLLLREEKLEAKVAQLKKILQIEQTRYKIGSQDMRNVAVAQTNLIEAQMELLGIQSELRIQRVNLYLALGGKI